MKGYIRKRSNDEARHTAKAIHSSCSAVSYSYLPVMQQRFGYSGVQYLEEASDILGVTLPEPAYLPKGLQVQEVYVYYYPPGGYYPQGKGNVRIIFSDGKVEKELIEYTDQDGITRLKYNIECRMRLQINWLGGEKFIPIKVPPGLEIVEINGKVGFIREKANVNTLTWQFPEFELYLSASRDALLNEFFCSPGHWPFFSPEDRHFWKRTLPGGGRSFPGRILRPQSQPALPVSPVQGKRTGSSSDGGSSPWFATARLLLYP